MACKCNMKTKLVGDGCSACNPELAKELRGGKKRYRVWFEQVNAQIVEVFASSEYEAKTKATVKWKRECAHADITQVRKEC